MVASTFMVFAVPEDAAWLQSLGVVTIRHGHLDRVLRLTIKTLAGVTVREAIDATTRENSSVLRGRIRKLAKQRLGDGAPLVKLQALLTRAQRATDRRNRLIHEVCGRILDEPDAQLLADDHTWKPLPSVTELDDLASELDAIVRELNNARLGGFILLALNERSHLASAAPAA